MRAVVPFLALSLLASAVLGEESPAPRRLTLGGFTEGLECESDPTQTYTLYLPSTFDRDRKWPVLLVFDPRGRSVMAAELFRDAAETHGWVIMSSNDTRSDGPMEPNIKAVNAMWPEAHRFYSIDPERIYAAGFSGGAMVAWVLGRSTGALAGVIGSGGRFDPHHFEEEILFACFGAAGSTDFNYSPMRKIHAQLERWGAPQRLEIFDDRHRWMPAELATQGVEWMELVAMKQGKRERDGELIERLYSEDAGQARELEAAGEVLAAQRRWAAVAATFEGLREIEDAAQASSRLAGLSEVEEALRQEKRWDAYEAAHRQRMNGALARLRTDPSMATRRLLDDLRLEELKRRAEAESYEGVVARRLLETLLTWTAFYMTRDLFAGGDYRSAAKVLTVASEIRPERPDIWYNLACAQARSGSRKKALTALEQALDAGFGDAEKLASDSDLESLRGEEGFRRLVARLGG
ncbi:MAG: hypothetical protein GY719_00525 [bacterium]|nr:hypothetical protein [bacterium]